jgi:hypothetical protein
MKIISYGLVGLTMTVAGAFAGSTLAAQDAASSSPPKVLQITREYTKPYKGGAAHDKTESAFVAAQAKAKFPVYYTALDSQSGKSRALFLTRYNSFAEWEKYNKVADANATMSAEIERAGLADGELLDEVDSYVFTYDADLSYHPHDDLQNHRVYQIISFQVRLGHDHEWHELVKMVKDAHEKAGDSAHWGMYEMAFGGPDGSYIALVGDPSMSAIDTGFAENKKFVEAMGGEEAMQKFDKLYGECVESSDAQLFNVNPKQSYVSEDWVKSDPSFWKPKAAATTAAKPAPPAQKSGE